MNRTFVLLGLAAFLLAAAPLRAEDAADRANDVPDTATEAENAVATRLRAEYDTGNPLATPKAGKKHDRVTVTINESTTAKHEATTDLKKDSSMKWDLTKWFTLKANKSGGIDATPRMQGATAKAPNLDFDSTSEQKSDGSTEAKQSFKSDISGEVMDVLPNGQLVVEARSSVTIGEEKRLVILTGRVDPKDLDAANTVDAKYLIDKKIVFSGEGAVTDTNKRSWGKKFLDKIRPW